MHVIEQRLSESVGLEGTNRMISGIEYKPRKSEGLLEIHSTCDLRMSGYDKESRYDSYILTASIDCPAFQRISRPIAWDD